MKKIKRDVAKSISSDEFVRKLRRLADAIEQNKRFEISISGERIYVPSHAEFSIEHERGSNNEEIEFQVTWKSR